MSRQRDSGTFTRMMGFMRRMRRSKAKSIKEKDQFRRDPLVPFTAAYTGPDCISRLNNPKYHNILRKIFAYVCPHVEDKSYEGSEHSVTDGCMLCDLRDLANCCMVQRVWYPLAAGMLYESIRIDAVHYCELEEILTDQRKQRSRHHEPIDPPKERLQQLCRTIRDNQTIANCVRYLKLPYMTRESCKADLARAVSVLPNLEYVDLPEGFYAGDPTCHTLRQELQARCPNIRKMKFNEGGEQALEFLLQGHWQGLKVLEISGLHIEPTILRRVLGGLPLISDITLEDLPWFGDNTFHSAPGLPEFPPLETLTMKNIRNVTHQGLVQWLSAPVCRDSLKTLDIKDCAGVQVINLHSILWAATRLVNFTYIASVTASLPPDPVTPLASPTLRVLNFEIVSSSSVPHTLYPPAQSYYQYLTNSLMANSLPALRQLYVRDPDFAESLTLAPPVRPFADSPQHSSPTFDQPLEVFAKGLDELEWVYTEVTPADAYGRRGSMSGGRPLSSYSASKGLGPQWGGDARKSIVVGNGFGGFLAIPADDERPKSAGHLSPGHARSFSSSSGGGVGGNGVRASWMSHAGREKRSSRADLWR